MRLCLFLVRLSFPEPSSGNFPASQWSWKFEQSGSLTTAHWNVSLVRNQLSTEQQLRIFGLFPNYKNKICLSFSLRFYVIDSKLTINCVFTLLIMVLRFICVAVSNFLLCSKSYNSNYGYTYLICLELRKTLVDHKHLLCVAKTRLQ